MMPIEAPWAQQRRVEVAGPVRRRHQQHVGGRRLWIGQLTVGREIAVGGVDQTTLKARPAGGHIEALHLDEQFVDDAGDALAHPAGAEPLRDAPMASNSSMKPIAPPSPRAALRSAAKYERILRFVCP